MAQVSEGACGEASIQSLEVTERKERAGGGEAEPLR